MRVRGRVGRVLVELLLVGVVMVGCSSEPAPTGRGLYEQAKGHYLAYREIASGILSAVYDGEWVVGDYGALPDMCDGMDGYDFRFTRSLRKGDPALRLQRWEAGIAAIRAAGLEVSAGVPDDPDAIWVAIARGQGIRRLVFDSSPPGAFSVSLSTDCHPGDSRVIQAEMFEEDTLVFEAGPYLPVRERPDAEPLFCFPLDAPRYPDPDYPDDPAVSSTPTPAATPGTCGRAGAE